MSSARTTVLKAAAVIAVWLACMPSSAPAEMIDGVVAVVDDTVIMYSDVLRRMERLKVEQLDRATMRQVLQMMIEDAVVAKVYNRMGLPPVEDTQAQRVSGEMGVDLADAKNFIMKSNIMELMVRSRVVITEAMIKDFYEATPQYKGVPSVHLKQILIENDDDRASRAMKILKAGGDFDEVARAASDILVGGSPDIGWVPLDQLAPEVKSVLDGVAAGRLAGPVRIGDKILIFQVVERGVTGGKPLEEVRDAIVETLRDRYREDAFRHWMSTVLAEYYIGVYL
jgi:parvulin-like peptidyl-prolyl isomerase